MMASPFPFVDSMTVCPGTGLPPPSSAVTVIVAAVAFGVHPGFLQAVIVGVDVAIRDVICDTPAGWTLKLLDVPLVTGPLGKGGVEAVRVYVPVAATVKLVNVAMPAVAVTGFVPPRVPLLGFKVIVTPPLNVVAVLPATSRAVTVAPN